MPHTNDYANQVVIAEHFTDVMNTVNRVQQAMWRMPESGGNEVLAYEPWTIAAHNGKVYIARHEVDGAGIDVRDADGGPLSTILAGIVVRRMSWRTNPDTEIDEVAITQGSTTPAEGAYWVKRYTDTGLELAGMVPYRAVYDESPTHPLLEYPTIEDGVAILNGAVWCEDKLYVLGMSAKMEVIEPIIDVGSGPATSTRKKTQWYVWVLDGDGVTLETHKVTRYFASYGFPILYPSNTLIDPMYSVWFRRTRNAADEIMTEDLRMLTRRLTGAISGTGDALGVWSFDLVDYGDGEVNVCQEYQQLQQPFLLQPYKEATLTAGEYENGGYYRRQARGEPCIETYHDDGGETEDAMVLTGYVVQRESSTGLIPPLYPCMNMVRGIGQIVGLGAHHAVYGFKEYGHEEIAETDETIGYPISAAMMDDKLYILHYRQSNYPTTPATYERYFSIRRRVVSEWEGFLKSSKATVGRFPSATEFKPYVEGVDYVHGQDNTHRRQDIPRQNITQIRAALIEILGAGLAGGAFFGWPPDKTFPINYDGFYDERMRWVYDAEVDGEQLWYPIWAAALNISLGGGVASVKGRGRYGKQYVANLPLVGLTPSGGTITAEAEEEHGLVENDYVLIDGPEPLFDNIYRVTAVPTTTTFEVQTSYLLDTVEGGNYIKLPLTWARADDRLAGKNMDDIDIGEVRELADVIERAMSHTHGT